MTIQSIKETIQIKIQEFMNSYGETIEFYLEKKRISRNEYRYIIFKNKREWFETRLGIGQPINLKRPEDQDYIEVLEGSDLVAHKLLIIELLNKNKNLEYKIECLRKK